jgi:hypothetical protein
MTRWRANPPVALRGAKLDNIALVPASLLPLKAQWQRIANGLPRGDVLIILPARNTPQRKVIEAVAMLFSAKGRHVTTILSEQFERKNSLL